MKMQVRDTNEPKLQYIIVYNDCNNNKTMPTI